MITTCSSLSTTGKLGTGSANTLADRLCVFTRVYGKSATDVCRASRGGGGGGVVVGTEEKRVG